MAQAAARQRPPLWRDIRILRVVGQVIFVAVVVIVLRELFLNAEFHLGRRGGDLSYDFLGRRAGFAIKEHVIPYSSNSSFLRSFVVAATNSMFVAAVGIILTTILGIFVGIARLTPNWLIRKIAQAYVEAFRNTPLLVQVIFWYSAVILTIPRIQDSLSLFDVAFVSNRGAAVPAVEGGSDFGVWLLFVLAGIVAAVVVRRYRSKIHDKTGQPHYRFLFGTVTFLVIAGVGYLLLGDPFTIDAPEQRIRNYVGGLQMSPEFAGILVALIIYTAAFIGEIVRGSILAVSKGQKEAAEALGLRPGQQLRLVVLPQAMRIAIPPINNQYLNLWKNTSLAFAIGFPDLINISTTMINQGASELQMFSLVAAIYLGVSLLISLVMNIVNRAVALRGARL
jgi:general L-amino acid transport system permease protein